jgi:NAD(P)-dependent dehydrogenase (short-subunit alcohol dehydrogenase family)
VAGRLEGKVAFVTGGSSGIGRAAALLYAAEGAAVMVASRRREPREGGLPTDELIRSNGGTADFIQVDVADAPAVDRAVAHTLETMSGLHVVLCSAGVIEPSGNSLEVDPAAFDELFAVNVNGIFHCAQSALRHFVRAGYGKFIAVSSNFGLVGVAGIAAYCASKAAVNNLVRSLALEFGTSGVNINALCPGATKTAMGDSYRVDPAIIEKWSQMTPLRMPGEQFIADAEDIANAALFLASDESRFMTGTCLVVDGGWVAH